MARIRIQRLESELFKIISKVLTFKVRDRDLQMVNLVEIKLTNDLSYAKIYYTTLEPNIKQVQQALERSKGFIKNEIAAAKFMRVVPELIFKFDDQAEKARQLDDIFEQIHAEEKKHED